MEGLRMMYPDRRQLGLLVFALTLTCAASASATTIRSFTVDELVRESAVVVRGIVGGQHTTWNAARDRIYTDTTVTVAEVLAGRASGPVLSVRQLGGAIDDVSLLVPGVARLLPGEEVILFLRTDGTRFYLVGMAQGKITVTRTRQGAVLGRDLDGLTFLPRPGAPVGGATPPPRVPLRLDDLVTRIRTLGGGR